VAARRPCRKLSGPSFDWHPVTKELVISLTWTATGLSGHLPEDELQPVTNDRQHFAFPDGHPRQNFTDRELAWGRFVRRVRETPSAPSRPRIPPRSAMRCFLHRKMVFPSQYQNAILHRNAHGSGNRTKKNRRPDVIVPLRLKQERIRKKSPRTGSHRLSQNNEYSGRPVDVQMNGRTIVARFSRRPTPAQVLPK